MNFVRFLRTPFLQSTSGRLLLYLIFYNFAINFDGEFSKEKLINLLKFRQACCSTRKSNIVISSGLVGCCLPMAFFAKKVKTY